VFYEQFHHAADADLFVVGEGLEPTRELVGALNLPGHPLNMPLDALCVKSYNKPVNSSALFDGRTSLKRRISANPRHKREKLADDPETGRPSGRRLRPAPDTRTARRRTRQRRRRPVVPRDGAHARTPARDTAVWRLSARSDTARRSRIDAQWGRSNRVPCPSVARDAHRSGDRVAGGLGSGRCRRAACPRKNSIGTSIRKC
jgi:hypothetical protein